MLDQVEATEAALELIEEIKKDYGDVIFHQSGAVSYTHLTLPTKSTV